MSLLHFSHEHPLILLLKEDKQNINGDDDDTMFCYGCHQPIPPPSAAAGGGDDDDDDDVYKCGGDHDICHDFYLHKKCAELPNEIQHPMHDPHPLILKPRPPYITKYSICNVCVRPWEWFTYNCISCHFDVCITCAAAVGDRSLRHVGHGQHTLSLVQRAAVFMCNACGTAAWDSSYICNSCEFWMHKTCALSPSTVEAGDIHHHPLVLIFSIPVMHLTFYQKCRICSEMVHTNFWMYYCDECTYFAHIKCIATSSKKDESETDPPCEDTDEDDLVWFPVDNKESFIHLITEQFARGNIDLEKRQGAATSITTTGDHPQTLINHWSHKDHPLILLEELVGVDDMNTNDQVEIICNGCIQPITSSAAHPFYGCIECSFFLHIFCVELPSKLPAGACSLHPQHPLVLTQWNKFNSFTCACGFVTNGFWYECETCDDVGFDICCCFVPKRIKHKSHNHSLLYSAPSDSLCKACGYECTYGETFKCERMSCNFQMHQTCALLPGTMRHRWDLHPIPLIYPPFDHRGLLYCEICEYEINTNYCLYHCRECDHSFHTYCIRPFDNMKVGIKKLLPGLHKHPLTFVRKTKLEHQGPFFCSGCSNDLGDTFTVFVLECINCNMLFCNVCESSYL